MYNFIKKTTGIIFILFVSSQLQAQRKPGNEWINYSQTYYKIKVVQNGIYRMGYSDLQNAGLNISGLNPTHLQMFYRGVEIPLYVSSGSKSQFSNSDFIEFFGRGNDGALDSVLYLNPADDINKAYSMYTDTSAYFLTVSTSPGTLRYRVSDKTYSNNPESYFSTESDLYLHQTYMDGVPLYPQFNFTESDYNAGEGWMGNNIACYAFGSPKSVAYKINIPGIPNDTSTVPSPALDMLVYGKSDVSNQSPDHHLVILLNNKIIWDTIYNGFATIHKQLQRYWSDVVIDGSGNASVTYIVQSAGVKGTSGSTTSDVNAVSYLKFIYACSFRIDPNTPSLNFSFINNSASAQSDFNFYAPSAPVSGKYLVLYDLTNNIRTSAFEMTGLNATLSIDNFKEQTNYFLYDTTQAKKILSITAENFTRPDTSKNYNYIIITNKAFQVGARAFSDYKTTQKIDSSHFFNPLVVYTDDLYDQFYYGVHHPAALQNFLSYIYKNSKQKPQYLLLLGKGINNAEVRSYFSSDYVPSIGYPPADVMFTAGIDIGFQGKDKVIDPKMGIGRLQVMNNLEIFNYLNKLKEYDASLQKRSLYLKTAINVDGGDNDQITQFQKFMDGQANFLSGPYAALKTTSYYSVSNAAVNKNLKQAIQSNIEHGTSMLSYLAHGAAEQFQVEIADTATLRNKGHYPIMYLNGCNLGNSFLNPNAQSSGRFYTLAKDKGAIIWLAHTNEAFVNILQTQMPAFYKNIAKDNYGQSVGSSWRKTITDLKAYHSSRDFRALCYAWELQGDPSVMFPSLQKPDYAIFDSLPYVGPKNVIASTLAYVVSVPVINFGKTDSGGLKIRIVQTFPDQSVKVFDSIFHPVNFMDTIYFNISRRNTNIQGINKFDIYVNYDSSVKEISYANNHASFSYYFEGNGVRTLFPVDFDIVNTDTPKLISQSRNPLFYNTGIYFEIDTTDLFNSPLKQTSALFIGSSLIEWTPVLNNRDKSGKAIDSTVYYWRARMNLPLDTGGNWESRSFVYLKNGHHGWSQSHWQQYKNIKGNLVNIDTNARRFNYLPSYTNLFVSGSIFGFGEISPDNGFSEIFGTNIGNCTVAMIEYQKNTLKPYTYNRITGKRLRAPYFNNVRDCNYIAYDLRDKQYRDSFKKEIKLIPAGNLVVLISRGEQHHQYLNLWDDSTFAAFESFGDTMMRHLKKDSVAFAIAGYKGSPKGKLFQERYKYAAGPLPGPMDTATMRLSIQGIGNDSGQILSQNIGPSTKWKTMFQEFRPLEKPNADNYFTSVTGITNTGADSVLFDHIKSNVFDLSKVDASKYPNLRLTSMISDTLSWTPPQLRLWQVEYDGIPDGSLIGDSLCQIPSGEYHQGDSIEIKIKFQNISGLPMSKVLVKFNISDNKNTDKDSTSGYYSPLQPGEFFWIDKKFSTQNLNGDNYLNVMVNPDFNQPEVSLDNNFIQSKFNVYNLQSNPVMDVTFDGIHIEDGQVVSPDPQILVRIKNFNRQLPLTDTSDFRLSIRNPGSSKPEPVWFSNAKVKFTPGDSLHDFAMINYLPGPLKDGTYQFNAQAWDRTGHIAGPIPYSIHFRVIESPAISNVYFYPNPLTGNSKFAFTITGTELPEKMLISIFDITGKTVKNIDLSNKIRIGANEIIWDGTNDNGANLSQGIYFYKVTPKLNGNTPGLYPDYEFDASLQKGFGKIMIIRN